MDLLEKGLDFLIAHVISISSGSYKLRNSSHPGSGCIYLERLVFWNTHGDKFRPHCRPNSHRCVQFLADRFAICLFCRNSIKCETSSVKRDFPLSEVLLPTTIMDLIGNWKFKYSHASHLAPYMVVTSFNTTTFE